MVEYLEKFRTSPASFKKGFYFLIGAWLTHFIFVYLFFTKGGEAIPDKILMQQAAIGGLMALFLFMIKKWARVLCILCNILIVVLYAAVFLIVYTNKMFSSLCVLTTILFIISTYFLAIKDTAQYFREQNPQDTDEPEDEEEPKPILPKKNKKKKKKRK